MVKLFFRKYGEGKSPLIILHGLFGMSDNWHNMAKNLSEYFTIYALDLRNHGNSPHTAEMNYKVMAEDVKNFMDNEKIDKANIIGHSMGGKVGMFFANLYPEKIIRMIIADISPRQYKPSHLKYIEAIKRINFNSNSRKEIEDDLSKTITNRNELLFILKNLVRLENNSFGLKINLNSLDKNYTELTGAIEFDKKITSPVLFMKGENSDYINSDDEKLITENFENVKFVTIRNAGHWIHAENPQDFLKETLAFLKN